MMSQINAAPLLQNQIDNKIKAISIEYAIVQELLKELLNEVIYYKILQFFNFK